MKKITAVLLAVILVASLFTFNMTATPAPGGLLVLGDSIATGYALTGYTAGNNYSAGSSFANKLGYSLGLQSGATYLNLAVDGARSSDLLAAFTDPANGPVLNGSIGVSKDIVLSVGGNDILKPAILILMSTLNSMQTEISTLGVTVKTSTAAETLQTLVQIKAADTTGAVMTAIQAAIATPASATLLIEGATNFTVNLPTIVTNIKAANTNAKIYILTLYNPFEGITGLETLSAAAAPLISQMNLAINTLAPTLGYIAVDVNALFTGKIAQYTNVAMLDVHPNSPGHDEIFKAAYKAITGKRYVMDNGVYAYSTLRVLNDMAPRGAYNDSGVAAANWLKNELVRIGYTDAQMIPFSWTSGSSTRNSNNVLAIKPGTSDKIVVVSAHYDCVTSGKGADDNASGVAVAMDIANRLLEADVPYTIHFLFCGAEESGLRGSLNYINSMISSGQKDKIVYNVNLDSLIGGDYMYIYGGNNGRSSSKTNATIVTRRWVFDQAWDIAMDMELNVRPNPGVVRSSVSSYYPYPTTGTWSDHDAFDRNGIPYLYFEGANWELDPYDGSNQTELFGEIMHTSRDNLDWILTNYPGRTEEHLTTFSKLLEAVLLNVTPPATPSWEDANAATATAWSGLSVQASYAGRQIMLDFGAPIQTYNSAPTVQNFTVKNAANEAVPVGGVTYNLEKGIVLLNCGDTLIKGSDYTVTFTRYRDLIVKDGTKQYAGNFTTTAKSVFFFPVFDINAHISNLVYGFGASIPISADNYFAVDDFYVALYNAEDNTKISDTVKLERGKGIIKIDKVEAASVYVGASLAADAAPIKTMAIPVNNVTNLWVPQVIAQEGSATLAFSATIAPASAGYAAQVNGNAATVSASTDASITVSSLQIIGSGNVKVSNVKYPALFPSYAFSFTAAYNAA